MVFNFLIKFLTNNEHLIQRLSESGPIRNFAKFVVNVFNRSKYLAEEEGLKEKLSPEKLNDIAKKFSVNIKEKIKQAQEQIKKHK